MPDKIPEQSKPISRMRMGRPVTISAEVRVTTHISRQMDEHLRAYALENGLCISEVIRKGLDMLLASALPVTMNGVMDSDGVANSSDEAHRVLAQPDQPVDVSTSEVDVSKLENACQQEQYPQENVEAKRDDDSYDGRALDMELNFSFIAGLAAEWGMTNYLLDMDLLDMDTSNFAVLPTYKSGQFGLSPSDDYSSESNP